MLIGFYNYSVILTYIGLCSSLYGITCAMSGGNLNYKIAFCCLIFSGVCDMFDGKIARHHPNRSEEAKCFGIQIDSLCDLICFGVFPAILANSVVYGPFWASGGHWLAKVGGALFVLAAVIRLGFYNVKEMQRQKETDENRKFFQGLPVTSSALIFPLIYAVTNIMGQAPAKASVAYVVMLYVVAFLMVWDIRVKKPGVKEAVVLGVIGALIVAGVLI